jgi:prepilin-type N-terminal cleavage/methylation domain-containing protein
LADKVLWIAFTIIIMKSRTPQLCKAFTLIELLVVIAIIAILAAILFPVFAQAKVAANKAKTITQFKQIGTSAAIYLADYDDNMPLAMSFNSATGAWRAFSNTAVPAGWTSTDNRHLEPRKSEESSMVLNALQPYIKNQQIFEAAGLPRSSSGWAVAPGSSSSAANVNITFNGLLHSYSATAITEVSKLPLFWSGHFKQNVNGRAISQPGLWCDQPNNPSCRFNPTGSPQTPATFPSRGDNLFNVISTSNMSVFLYGRSMPFVSADTSARVLNLTAPTFPNYSQNINTNPFSSYRAVANGTPDGVPYWVTECVADGAAFGSMTSYIGYFRPDNDFDWNLTSCNHTP